MALPEVVTRILRSTAPTLLTALALPPPLNLIGSAVVSGLLNRFLPDDEAPAQQTASGPVLSPAQVTTVIERNAGDPQFLVQLKQAEVELRKYETEAGIRFAEIEARDRQGMRDFQKETGIADRVFGQGMLLVKISLVCLGLVVVGALVLAVIPFQVGGANPNLVTAAFSLVGTAVGFINGIAANVVSYYWGSSQGSKEKTDTINEAVRNLGQQLGDVATRAVPAAAASPRPAARTLERDAPDAGSASGAMSEPAKPAPPGLLGEVLPQLTEEHQHFPEGVSWRLTAGGVAIEGAAARGTAGKPETVTRIWARYGDLCAAAAKHYGVPVELIVATIATESGGDPNARRPEPKIRDESVGLMQTLVATARGALGRRDLKGDELLDPATSINAGTAYIAQQRGSTHFDPPLVAAAYNAGSLKRDNGPANRWKLLCFPTGTGRHIDKYVEWFADCMVVSAEQGWGRAEGAPSFAAGFGPPET